MKRKGYVVEELPSKRFSLRLIFHSGERQRAGQTFETWEDADAAGRSTAAELGLDTDEGLSLANYVTEKRTGWLDRRDQAGKRANDDVRSIVRTWIEPSRLWQRPLTSIRKRDIKDLVLDVFEKRAEQTARNVFNVMRRILADALDEGRVRENVAAGVRVPKRPRADDGWTFLSLGEIDRVLALALPDERDVIEFAIYTGLRSGELRALRLSDLVLDDAHPRITVRFGAPGQPTKSGKPREVPLNHHALSAVRRWLSVPRKNRHGVVFPGERGRYRPEAHLLGRVHVAGNIYVDRWAVLAAQAGLFDVEPTRPVVWHTLRHTHASHLVSGSWGRRWSLEEVQSLLGHQSITTTQRYAHLASSTLREAARSTGLPSDDETPGKPGVSLKTTEFLNRRSRFQLTPGAPKSQGFFDDRKTAVDIVWEVVSACQRDDAESAEKAAIALAEWVLADECVRLALDVLDGGPNALSRALELAERVADEEPARSPFRARGAS